VAENSSSLSLSLSLSLPFSGEKIILAASLRTERRQATGEAKEERRERKRAFRTDALNPADSALLIPCPNEKPRRAFARSFHLANHVRALIKNSP